MFYHKLRLDGRFAAEQELPVLLTIAQSLIRNFITVYAQGDERVACVQVLVKLDKCVLAAVRRLKRVGSEDEMLFHHLVTREMCGSMYYLAALYCLKYATTDDEDRMVCGCVGWRCGCVGWRCGCVGWRCGCVGWRCRSGCVGWGGDVGVGVWEGGGDVGVGVWGGAEIGIGDSFIVVQCEGVSGAV